MTCRNQDIHVLLGDYHSGHLPPKAIAAVRGHLLDCLDCRKALQVMELLGGASVSGENQPESHLDSQIIAALFDGGSTISSEQRAEAEQHLKDCEECAYELAFLKEMNESLVHSAATVRHRATMWEQVFNPIRVVALKPAFVYFLLLLTVYPTYKFLLPTSENAETPVGETFSAREQILRETMRSGGDNVVVYRYNVSEVIQLSIPFFHAVEQFRYTLLVSDSTQKVLADLDFLSDFMKEGTIRMALPTNGLVDGKYEIVILEIDRLLPTDTSQHVFQFQLETAE